MRVDFRSLSVLGGAVALAVVGCIGADEGADGDLGTAALPQIDASERVWRDFALTFGDPARTELGHVHVVREAVGTYVPGTEYWYVNEDSLDNLGRYPLDISHVEEDSTTAPPAPRYAGAQTFTLPQSVSWGTGWTTDPVSGGTLHGGPNGVYLRLERDPSTALLAAITWYQVLPSEATPHNITPDGTFSITTSVSVPANHVGYDISQRP